MKPSRENRRAVSVDIEIPFHDVDSIGIVWHGHMYKYLEIARTALFRARGLDMAQFRELGYGLVLMESRCRHGSALRYGDVAKVEAWFGELGLRIEVHYLVTNVTTGARAARAFTAIVTTDGDGKLCFRTPEPILVALEK